MGDFSCVICKNASAKRACNDMLRQGITGKGIAETMTFGGFPVTAPTVLSHKKHAAVETQVPATLTNKRDLAHVVRDRVQTMVEEEEIDFLDKNHMAAVNAGLKAESEINKQVNKAENRKLDLVALLSGASRGRLGVPAALLIDDGNTIEGEFEPVGCLHFDLAGNPAHVEGCPE